MGGDSCKVVVRLKWRAIKIFSKACILLSHTQDGPGDLAGFCSVSFLHKRSPAGSSRLWPMIIDPFFPAIPPPLPPRDWKDIGPVGLDHGLLQRSCFRPFFVPQPRDNNQAGYEALYIRPHESNTRGHSTRQHKKKQARTTLPANTSTVSESRTQPSHQPSGAASESSAQLAMLWLPEAAMGKTKLDWSRCPVLAAVPGDDAHTSCSPELKDTSTKRTSHFTPHRYSGSMGGVRCK